VAVPRDPRVHDREPSAPARARLHHLFEATVDRQPSAIALECEGRRLTYLELDGLANRLARFLLAGRLHPGSRVGILVPRSVEMYVALLGALKAGATFVPIDPASPTDVVAFIGEDSSLDAVLTTSSSADLCADHAAWVVHVDQVAPSLPATPQHRPFVPTVGDPTCYILYTSDSSGRPTGVEVSHSSICNFVSTVPEIYGVRPTERVYQGMTISFGLSIQEIWPTWAMGGTLVAGPTDGRRVGPALADFLEESGITMLHCVPAVLATMGRTVASTTTVNLGDRACPPELVARWAPGRRILSTYGPTEATVACIWAEVRPGEAMRLGRPLPTYRIGLVDENLRPVRYGEVGEICVGGPGVARGYVNRPDLTAERFVPDPRRSDGARIYRTGDLGRYVTDGEIEYVGRADTEAKDPGHRLELRGIKSALVENDRVTTALSSGEVVRTDRPEPPSPRLGSLGDTYAGVDRWPDGLTAQAHDPAGSSEGRPRRPWVAVFGLAQLGWVYSLLVVVLLPIGVVYGINDGVPSWAIVWQLLLALLASYLFGRWVVPLVGIRLLTAGLESGRFPLWGGIHLRVWAAEKLMTLSPLGVLSGSPWAETYLRLAGARVGEGCHIGTAEIPLPPFLSLEDGATVGYATHLRSFDVSAGELTIGVVEVGRDAVVSGNCVLQGPCRVGDGAILDAQSLLRPGDVIPEWEQWVGSPVRPREDPGDRVFELMAECTLAPRTWPRALLPWFAIGLALLELLPVLALAPVAGLVWWTLLTWGGRAALVVTALSGPVFVLTTCGLILAVRRLALPATPMGVHHLRSRVGMQRWFGDKLLELSHVLTRTLYATLFTRMWMRALGARDGRGAEVCNGHVAYRVTDAGRRAFVGNDSSLSPGAYLVEDLRVGVLTASPAAEVDAGAVWLGSPPVLPEREMAESFTAEQSSVPTHREFLARCAIEALRVVLPSSILAVSVLAALFALSFVADVAPMWAVVLMTPATALMAAFAVVLSVAAVKWAVVGRYRPRVEPLRSGFVRRTHFVTGIYEAAAVPALLAMLAGTPLLGPVLRLFGVKAGRRTLLDTTYVTGFDLVHVGDDVSAAPPHRCRRTCSRTG
jgi:amino acid adenylation domain-containing protein